MGREARRRPRALDAAIQFDELDLYKLRTTLAESNQTLMQAQQAVTASNARVRLVIASLAEKYGFPSTASRFEWDEKTSLVRVL